VAATVRSADLGHLVAVAVARRRGPPQGKRMEELEKRWKNMAGTTGLEPATSDVTGRRSNQLNYVPALQQEILS
jgi:hypothetical protein